MTRVPSSTIYDYDFLEQIGVGTFGCVYRAKHKLTNSTVAVKVMKSRKSSNSNHWQEYKTMKRLSSHPNIVHFYDGFTGPSKRIYFVMEFINGGNLYQLLKERRENRKLINESEIRLMLRQILGGLASIHDQGYVHRDLKPENLLVEMNQQEPTQLTIKLADFGLARELKCKTPCTDYVSTRWYRAPEVLLKSSAYSTPVDIWATGTIMAELVALYPLFPGNSEIDQLFRICEILGSPGENITMKKKSRIKSTGFTRKKSDLALQINTSNKENINNDENITFIGEGGEWKDGVRLASKLGFKFPQMKPKGLSNALPTASNLIVDVIHRLLMLDPSKRLNAHDALGHPFFIDTENTTIARPLSHQESPTNRKITANNINTTVLDTSISQNITKPTALANTNIPNIELLPCMPSPFLESKFDFNNLSSDNIVLIEKSDHSHELNLAPTTTYDQRQRYSTPNMYSVSFQFECSPDIKEQLIIAKSDMKGDNHLENSTMQQPINGHNINEGSENNNVTLTSISKNLISQESFNSPDQEEISLSDDIINSNQYKNLNYSLEHQHHYHHYHQRHESLNDENILINVRPSFSTPLNHQDHLQQQQRQYHHHHQEGVKKKQSTSFSQFFGLRKKPQPIISKEQQVNSNKYNNNNINSSSNKIKTDKLNNKKIAYKTKNTLKKSADINNSNESVNIPRTESFSSFLKHITSSSSMKPALLSKKSQQQKLSNEIEQQQQLKIIPSYRRSSSMTLLNTYYQDETKNKLEEKSFNKNRKSQLHNDILAYNNYPSTSTSTSTPLIFN
ncbi:kinase-like domain-containing protein [Cunninghamella echinulata]|nr:kinase-like domain-containing protein [Cunninghamella echinulata]